MTVDELKIAAGNRWGEVFAYYGIDPGTRGHLRCILGTHPDRHPSFRIDVLNGRYYCTCSNGDALDLVQAMEHCTLAQAVERVAGILLLGPGESREERDARLEALYAERERERRVDGWHDRMCREIGRRRKENGPPPERFSWDWAKAEADINTLEGWVDHVHGYTETHERVENGVIACPYRPAGGAGKGYVRPPDRFEVVRTLCAAVPDDYGKKKAEPTTEEEQ